ncbi:quinone oxidoreductase family protein [Hahella sp. NBU794]|uniref:quinone oxidoreductase family protein n=1 Tax=Hahella sp. NBU794 TaxID=3422590 RepID=UPI003D6F0D44
MSTPIRIEMSQIGEPSVLQPATFQLSPPAPGEVRLRHRMVGVNFVDIYFRCGLYPIAEDPRVLGVEAVGVVEALGDGVTGLSIGQRVAYAGFPLGSYASHRNVAAERLLPVPDSVSDEAAASALLRGMTAHMLLNRVRPVAAGESMLVHAAAGGLGQVLGQWASRLGVRLIGTVGNAEKAEIARRKGYDDVILYREQDFAEAVKTLTDGAGVDYVIDGVGADTLMQSLASVGAFGTVANIGQPSGMLQSLPMDAMARAVQFTRPSVLLHMMDLRHYRISGNAVMEQLANGLTVDIADKIPLEQAAQAHALLQSGQTVGAVLLSV